MRKFFKTLISAAAALSLCANSAFAAVPTAGDKVYEDDEIVTFIVEVEGDALLASESAAEMGVSYLETAEAAAKETALLKTQAQVQSEIKSTAKVSNNVGYTYTAVMNGFSIEAPKSKLDDIKAIDGVTNVVIATSRQVKLGNAVEMSSSLPSQTADDAVPTGYTGEGQVIAIIDTEFDTGHEFFQTAPENPKYSKSDIASILDANTMNVDISANQVYKSAKIPFAYDYVNGSADTYPRESDTVHGTIVAGVAAGSNGSISVKNEDGEEMEYAFSGVAPEAQLVLMKVSDADGHIDDPASIAAIDDAVKLGVCAINISFGTDYTSEASDTIYETVFTNARNAGIMLLVGANNSGLGYDKTSSDTSIIDYSTSGSPACYSEATAVAAINDTDIVAELGILTAADGTTMYYKNTFSASTFDTDFAGQTLEYVYCGYGSAEDFEGLDLSGKIALTGRRNDITFRERAENAAAAGAVGLIVFNISDGVSNIGTSVELCLPTVMIEKSAGEYLRDAETKTITVSEISEICMESENAGTLYSLSSFGVDETLELKPEITAPGGNILSSVPDDQYAIYTGTSLAAPHMAGAAALMNEYLDKNGIDISGNERVTLIENMLMSAADVIYQPENTEGEIVPYSPRVQGAGLVNTAAAMKTAAVFIGNSGKSKLSLGDKIDDSFTLEFAVKNITDKSVTYDAVSLDVQTDGYLTDEYGPYTVQDNAVRLTVLDDDAPESITIPAGGEAEVSITVTLDNDELTENAQVYTNGFYIDGFVTLSSSSEDIVTISMPFTGFYGDWTSQSIFDKTMYDEGGSELYYLTSYGTVLYTYYEQNGEQYKYDLGADVNGEYDRDKIAISPNGDDTGDTLGLSLATMRAVKNLKMTLTGNDVDITHYYTDAEVWGKYTQGTLDFSELDDLSAEELPDGEYVLTVSGEFNYEGAKVESFTLPVKVDRVKPEITNAVIDGNTLYVSASDNNYLYSVDIIYTDENGETVSQTAVPDTEKGGEYTAKFDISGLDTDDITIEVSDFALNETTTELKNVLGTVTAEMTNYIAVANMTSLTVNLTNTGESDITGEAVIAFYDEDGALIAVSSQSVGIDAGSSATCVFQMFTDTQEAVEARLFIWDGIRTMHPSDKIKSFELN
ncbi:MAG: S8 family serine peptidase [Clostridia bacterium]|nr:S8 family serine peptidase [Clostridia bacterium]